VTTESTVNKDDVLPAPAGSEELSDIHAVSLRRFFITAAAVASLMIAVAWVWAVHGRMWFLDPEYPMWRAKMHMIETCNVGETTILGDSRAMAGLVPAQISDTTVNLAVGGATPIESLRIAESIAKCPNPPKRVVFSFLPLYLMDEQVYWERTALFNYLDFGQMEELRRDSLRLSDSLVYPKDRFNSFLDKFKNYGYSISFPTFYFPAMVNAGFVGRKERNELELQATLNSRGQHFFGMAERSDWLAPETLLDKFEPTPVLNYYFDRVLAVLAERGIKVYFVGAPFNETSYERLKPETSSTFIKYLKDIEASDPNFRMLGVPLFSMPNENFGDIEHVNPRGAAKWSASVAELLKTAISQERKISAWMERRAWDAISASRHRDGQT
jgi:hypothetical protein